MGDKSIGPRYLDEQEPRLHARISKKELAKGTWCKYLDVQQEAGV
jgi:hypothetical protein